MTDLVTMTFVDNDGVERHLDEEEIVNYATLLAAAGNETTTRLIGWTGYLLAKYPGATRAAPQRSQPHPGRDRGDPPLRSAVAGAGPLRLARRRVVRHHGA